MKPQSELRCRICGRSASDEAVDGACPYCLLQLGLGLPGARTGPVSESSLPLVEGSLSSRERFIRQGVLPQFGDYELESEIARGGMGVVYRARQRSLNRTVAIKMILAGQLASPESVQRFRLEAEAAARLHHPGIVPIYEIGEFDTQHFFSMKLIEGVSLAECLGDFQLLANAGPADRREQQKCIAELMVNVARALEFAHQRGVLHRDLKPSNILIDEQGQPHLTDFGLAKLTGREASGITLSAAVLGTPGYLAPEQAAGLAEQVTTAADIYGLGATLYELLTGKPPFVGATSLETMWMAIEHAPKPPRQVNAAVHRDLETIALRCLEKAPERRYSTAANVAEELERFIRHEPILARPVSRIEHAWRWCQRNPRFAGLAVTLMAAIAIGSGTAFWQWGRAESANVKLTENVEHLEWAAIDRMLESGESSSALARVALLLRGNPDDRKGAMFAMSVLEQRRFPVPMAPQIRHPSGSELSVARLSPDGTRVVTASFDGTARIWDTRTSQLTGPPLQHQGPVNWAEFSPDGVLVATCSNDKSMRLWEVASGQPVGEPFRHDEAVLRVQFSADGRHLLTQTRTQVALLDGRNGHLRSATLGSGGQVVATRFLSDGIAFFTARQTDGGSRIQVWDAETGQPTVGVDIGKIRSADVSNEQSHLTWTDDGGRGWVAEFPSGQQRKELVKPGGILESVRFNPDGGSIAAISGLQWARVWDTRTALPVTAELPHFYLLNGVKFLSHNRLLTWGNDAQAQVWDIPTSSLYSEPMRQTTRVVHAEAGLLEGQEIFLTTMSHLKSRSERTQTGAVQIWRTHSKQSSTSRLYDIDLGGMDGGAMSADGRLSAIGKTTHEVKVLETATGKEVCPPLPIKGNAWGLMFSLDGKRLIISTSRGQVSLFSIPDGKLMAPQVELPTTIQPAELSRDGQYFATGSTDGFVRVWDANTCQLLREMHHGSEINSIEFSPDGNLLASGGEDRMICFWDPRTGSRVRQLAGHKNEVMSIAFSPNGQRFASASLDFTARLWDTRTGRELAILPHQGEVLDTVFSPDGRWLATASRDRTAVIWDSLTGAPHSRNLVHHQGVRNVQFSPDSRHLLTLDFKGLRLWDIATSHPLTVHLPHQIFGGTGFQCRTGRPVFAPDGSSVLLSISSEDARLWYLSIPQSGAPQWFAELLEAVAGQRFVRGSDRSESVPQQRFLELEERLKNSAETDYYTRWARRWLFTKD